MILNLPKWIGPLALLGVLLASAPIATAKDAPKPKAPSGDWRKYVFEDIKAPTPRPKSFPGTGAASLKGSSTPMAKDAPKPTDPPSDWRKYVFEDIKAPTPRPKSFPGTGAASLKGSSSPMAKDAPKPTDPPSDWRKYVFEDIKAPTPRPKSSVNLDPLNPVARPTMVGFPPPQQSASQHKPFPPKNPPYTHPPRDFKGPKGPKGPLN